MSKLNNDPVSPPHPLFAPPQAKPVVAWVLVNPEGRFIVGMARDYPPPLGERDRSLGWRVARVEIREIEEVQSDD